MISGNSFDCAIGYVSGILTFVNEVEDQRAHSCKQEELEELAYEPWYFHWLELNLIRVIGKNTPGLKFPGFFRGHKGIGHNDQDIADLYVSRRGPIEPDDT